MVHFILWYLVLAFLQVIIFPLGFRIFRQLADRGYAFGRILGLLIWGYLFWLLGSYGVLKNDLGGIFFALGGVAFGSLWVIYFGEHQEIQKWLKENTAQVIFVEVLFLLAFGAWTFVRAANPDILGTEKPMELAFINAILRSPSFPPYDPWLSGYAISYYYFGYVLVAVMAAITATPSGVAFNLGVALAFGLGVLGAYGLVFNLLSVNFIRRQHNAVKARALALFGPIFVFLIGNFEGVLELFHAKGWFWRTGPDGMLASDFWQWLGIKDLSNPPVMPFSWNIDRFWWWWRASRVVTDLDFNGYPVEVIDEFPFFSFLLGDLHPHVLTIPFLFLVVGLALNIYLKRRTETMHFASLALYISPLDFGLSALTLGALAFLNAWDFPIALSLFGGVYVLMRVRADGWSWDRAKDFLLFTVGVGILGMVLFLPFYVGFSSQAGGILPNILNPTRGIQLWVMFGVLFIPIFVYLFWLLGNGADLRNGLVITLTGIASLYALSMIFGWAISLLPEVGTVALARLGAPDLSSLIRQAVTRRLNAVGTLFTLGTLLAIGIALLLKQISPKPKENNLSTDDHEKRAPHLEEPFVLLMIVVAGLLILGPEFLFLRDFFGSRMNTVFKFYYQAWLLMGAAAGYSVGILTVNLQALKKYLYKGLIGVVIVCGLVYSTLSLLNKTEYFNPAAGYTLDGTQHTAYLGSDDQTAVRWLKSAPLGVLVEAVGGSYSSGARIATHSGMPGLLGWPFHETQWRGGAEEMGTREADIQQIYESRTWDPVAEILEKYNVRYIYVGPLERATYRVNDANLEKNLLPVFQEGTVIIYQIP